MLDLARVAAQTHQGFEIVYFFSPTKMDLIFSEFGEMFGDIVCVADNGSLL